ncbi:enolase-like [Brassica rapa]|uniref:BnaA05g34310D protein n=3 Tax=Brassica TaxID=3705 RepID=A0A078JRG5_BRANA|nr:enolase-like [Brassica rapa]XP_033138658.1 enolase-like [Brassica rapa]KAH0871116.1 hypothetical protein HID58_078138 [Brassica napus]CAF2093912.1 unnamed protein product [Brassica napus]CAF2172295.1 unnamed protein product [Brassica napus]CDY55395.1 BnaA05g34310D [Brassica napus]CDY69389.1 BnaAnng30290D [Brassica napus]
MADVSVFLSDLQTGRPSSTVQVHLLSFWEAQEGVKVTDVVPSGASIGIYESETLELSDGGSNYLGKDVSKAVDNFMVYELMEPKTSGVNAIKIKSLEPMISLMRANLGPFSMAFVSTKGR